MTTISPQCREQMRRTLKRLHELTLKDKVIIPHFRGEGWICHNLHGKSEAKHKCDVVLKLETHPHILRGIQLKTQDIERPTYVSETILPAAQRALRAVYDSNLRLHSYYWITTGTKSPLVRTWTKDWIEPDPLAGGRVVIWDLDDLINDFRPGSPLLQDGLFGKR